MSRLRLALAALVILAGLAVSAALANDPGFADFSFDGWVTQFDSTLVRADLSAKESTGAGSTMVDIASSDAMAADSASLTCPGPLPPTGPAGSNLSTSFQEVGLGNTTQCINYLLTADITEVYACINGGSNHPKAGNKETLSGPVQTTGSFSSDGNGQIRGSMPLSPLGPGSFSCPNGQTLVLASVIYTNVTITDLTDILADGTHPTATLTGSFTKTLVPLN